MSSRQSYGQTDLVGYLFPSAHKIRSSNACKRIKLIIVLCNHRQCGETLQIQFSTYKLFRTEYRPFMIKLEAELCKYVADRDHPTFKLPRNDEGINWSSPELGNLWDPCPYYVT